MREADLSAKVTSFIERQNGIVLNITGSRYQQAGIPDLYITHIYTRSFWLELKVGNNKLTKLQKHMMDSMNNKGANALVLRHAKGFHLERTDGTVIATCSSLNEVWQILKERFNVTSRRAEVPAD